jgi:regulator of protease activity HflC (stomatin/prohibitin superfamily)
MKKNHLLLLIILIIAIIGLVVFENLTAITIAEIQYGEWEKTTQADGTIFYTPWHDFTADKKAMEQHEKWAKENQLKIERVTGYGVQILRIHKIQKKPIPERLHLFSTQETAIRFAKESGIPTSRIIL